MKEYLKTHPKDSELQQRLTANQGKLAEMNAGIARTPEERAAFAALNAHHLTEAESRFQAMLDSDEKNARAAAGMGFLRMQQSNFGAAVSYLEQSEQNGFRDRSVSEGLATSRFWFTMGEASLAFDVNQFDAAAEKYKAALEMRPRSPEALEGLAGVYSKNQQYSCKPSAIYQQILKIAAHLGRRVARPLPGLRPQSPEPAGDGRHGPLPSLGENRPQSRSRLPANSGQYLPGHWPRRRRAARAGAGAGAAVSRRWKQSQDRNTRLQYAGILMAAKRYDQAAELYKQILAEETSSLPAWMGLVTADHNLQHDNEAIALVQKMPPDTYETALKDPGFLSMLGSIYQQSNQFEIAQGLLERSVRLQTQAGGQPSIAQQIQLAAIYLQRNNTAQAYDLYHQILEAHPDNLDAWRGLIGTLQQTNRNAEALQEIKLIPPAIRKQLEADVQFEQSEASLYANAGDTVDAIELFNQVQKHYATLRQQPPADVEIQQAYLLYNTFNDRALYPMLMSLGARQDLSNTQRETIQGLWANWSVRRAALAFDNGNGSRAIDILDAAAQAFPDNLTVRKAVAGGYLRVGRAKESLQIFKQIDFQDATSSDFQGAIGSALAANDKAQAEQWLRQALDRFPRDSGILALAARFEQARGDNARAADYWRASIAAMPEVSPADKLAHELVHPEADQAQQPRRHAQRPGPLAQSRSGHEWQKRAKHETTPSAAQLRPRSLRSQSAPVILNPQPRAMGPPRARLPVYQVPTTTTQPLPSSETNPRPQWSPAQQASPNGPGTKSASQLGGTLRLQTGMVRSIRPPQPRSLPPPPKTVSARTRTRIATKAACTSRLREETVASTDDGGSRAQPAKTQQPVYPQLVPNKAIQQPAPQQNNTPAILLRPI